MTSEGLAAEARSIDTLLGKAQGGPTYAPPENELLLFLSTTSYFFQRQQSLGKELFNLTKKNKQ